MKSTQDHLSSTMKGATGRLSLFAMFIAVVQAAVSSASAGVLTFDFETNPTLPNVQDPSLTRTATGTVVESVSGGSWNADMTATSSTLYYAGNNSVLATSNATLGMSINVKLRFLAPVNNAATERDFWIRFAGPAGTLFMVFNYPVVDGATNQVSGLSSGLTANFRNTGTTFSEFHTYSFTWDPAQTGSSPGRLWVDGAALASPNTFVDTTRTSTAGYIEFGDGGSGSYSGTIWEVESLRFGNDLTVVPEPEASALFALGALSVGLLRLRRRAVS